MAAAPRISAKTRAWRLAARRLGNRKYQCIDARFVSCDTQAARWCWCQHQLRRCGRYSIVQCSAAPCSMSLALKADRASGTPASLQPAARVWPAARAGASVRGRDLAEADQRGTSEIWRVAKAQNAIMFGPERTVCLSANRAKPRLRQRHRFRNFRDFVPHPSTSWGTTSASVPLISALIPRISLRSCNIPSHWMMQIQSISVHPQSSLLAAHAVKKPHHQFPVFAAPGRHPAAPHLAP